MRTRTDLTWDPELVERHGWRRGFVIGLAVGAVGAALCALLGASIAAAAECPAECLPVSAIPVGRGFLAPQACQCDGDEPTDDNWRLLGAHGCLQNTACQRTAAGSEDNRQAASTLPCREVASLPLTCGRGECADVTDSALPCWCTATNTWTCFGSSAGSGVTSQAGTVGKLVTVRASDGQTVGPHPANAICSGSGTPRTCCTGSGTGNCEPGADVTSHELWALGFRVWQHATDGACVCAPEGADDGVTECCICAPNSGLASDGSTRVYTTGCKMGVTLRTHATDCTSLTDGVANEPCYEADADALYVCEPTSGGCDTPGEWRPLVPSGGLQNGQACLTMEALAAGDDDFEFWMAPASTTLVEVTCHCDLNCGTPATLSFQDRAANAIALTGGGDLTCGTGSSASTYTTFDTGDSDRLLVKGEGLAFDTTNTPTADQRVTICVRFTL